MHMSSANTNIDMTIGILKNLTLDFGVGKVMVQVQILTHGNFDLLLGWLFHYLISMMIEDFPDGLQTITLCNLNIGKQFTLPLWLWSEGCPCCHKNKHLWFHFGYTGYKLVVKKVWLVVAPMDKKHHIICLLSDNLLARLVPLTTYPLDFIPGKHFT